MPTKIFPLNSSKKVCFDKDDRAFLGEGLFETIKIDNKKPLYPSAHWQRMSDAAKILQIPFDVSKEVWQHHLLNCIQEAKLEKGGVKVILSGGQAPRGLVSQSECSDLSFQAFSYTPNSSLCSLLSAPWRRDSKNPIYRLKSINYLENILARRYALSLGADDALFFNSENHATETTVANLFLIKENGLLTPGLQEGVLGGIVRNRLISLCHCDGIASSECAIDEKTIREADAAFTTNALQGLRVISSWDGFSFSVQNSMISHLHHLFTNDPQRFQ